MGINVLFFLLITALTTTFGQVLQNDDEAIEEVALNDFHPTGKAIEVRMAVDDKMEVFADGKLVATDTQWNRAKVFNIPLNTKVVAVKAVNLGGPKGIIAHFDGGKLFTDGKRWRCRGQIHPDWLKESFDDSDWSLAKEISYKGGKINRMAMLLDMAKWIWSSNPDDKTVYCRALFDVTAYIRADDKFAIYADGNWIGTNTDYRDIRSFDIPGNTRLIAIRAKNRGGPYGIRASFGGKRLITSSMGRWRCGKYNPDWAKPTFSDKSWPVAKIAPGPVISKCGLIDRSAKWIWGKVSRVTYCRAYLSMFATFMVDDHMNVYADGALVKTNRLWKRAVRFKIDGAVQLIAIKAYNTGGPFAIRGFVGGGRLVTGAHWKCSHTPSPNWNTLSFDDSAWPAAKVVTYNVPSRKFIGPDTSAHGSQWIWANAGNRNAYCRGFIRKAPLATVATGMDVTQLGTNTVATSDDPENLVLQKTPESNIDGVNNAMDNVAGTLAPQAPMKQKPKKGEFNIRSKQVGKKNKDHES